MMLPFRLLSRIGDGAWMIRQHAASQIPPPLTLTCIKDGRSGRPDDGCCRLEEAMPLWKLTPLDLLDPGWGVSSHRGVAIVRAREWRMRAPPPPRRSTSRSASVPEKGHRFPPWSRAALVKVERIEDTCYDGAGPAAVLEPVF
jgi:hypothetical protein